MYRKLCGLWDSVHYHINACSQLTAGSSIGELSDEDKLNRLVIIQLMNYSHVYHALFRPHRYQLASTG